MQFLYTDWTDKSLFDENIKNLASNLFRIKFYFDEDQLDVLNMIEDLEIKQEMQLMHQNNSEKSGDRILIN